MQYTPFVLNDVNITIDLPLLTWATPNYNIPNTHYSPKKIVKICTIPTDLLVVGFGPLDHVFGVVDFLRAMAWKGTYDTADALASGMQPPICLHVVFCG